MYLTHIWDKCRVYLCKYVVHHRAETPPPSLLPNRIREIIKMCNRLKHNHSKRNTTSDDDVDGSNRVYHISYNINTYRVKLITNKPQAMRANLPTAPMMCCQEDPGTSSSGNGNPLTLTQLHRLMHRNFAPRFLHFSARDLFCARALVLFLN